MSQKNKVKYLPGFCDQCPTQKLPLWSMRNELEMECRVRHRSNSVAPNGAAGQGCWLIVPPFICMPKNPAGTAPTGGASTVISAAALPTLPALLLTRTQ